MSVKNKPKTLKYRSIAKSLSLWFQTHARTLPWRSHPDPYSVWISEIMLQQTQVTAVLPYFKKFMTHFPTVQDLAHASLDEVYVLWAGLGYYSRARNLHRGAITIAERLQNGQGFPQNREEWLLIPGVGEYTAGAICSIAFSQREPIVDGNVVRVISRLQSIKTFDSKKTVIWKHALALVKVPSVQPEVLNQSLMELGALICKPKNPNCSECPVSQYCSGQKYPERYPAPKLKKEWKLLQEHKWILIHKENLSGLRVYFEKNKKGIWREGLWDFPNAGVILGLKTAKVKEEFNLRYVVTTHKIERKHTVLELTAKGLGRLQLNGSWFSTHDLPGVPAPVKKAILKLLKTRES